jgi:hypothetical protein
MTVVQLSSLAFMGSVANVVHARKSGLRMQMAQQAVTGLKSEDAIRLSVAYTYCARQQSCNAVAPLLRVSSSHSRFTQQGYNGIVADLKRPTRVGCSRR